MARLTLEQIRAAYRRWLENPDEDTTIGQLTAQEPATMERLFAMFPAGGRSEGFQQDNPEDESWRIAEAIREAKRNRVMQMRSATNDL